MFDQDLRPDQDEDDAPEDPCVFFQHFAQTAAQIDRQETEDEGRNADGEDAGEDVDLQKGKGDADGKGIDAGGDSQQQDMPQGQIVVLFLCIFFACITDHVDADDPQQQEGDPVIDRGDERLKQRTADPAGQWHQRLEQTEPERQHAGVLEAIVSDAHPFGDRYGKSVHAQRDADQKYESE